MHITTTKCSSYDLAEIVKPGARTTSVIITFDDKSFNSPKSTITRWLYCDLMKSGAGKYTREDFAHKLNELGSDISITEGSSRITLTVTALEEKLKQTLELLEMMFIFPKFYATELKRAKQTLKSNLILQQENAKAISLNKFKNSIFTASSRFSCDSIGDLIKAIPEVDIKSIKSLHDYFLKSWWTASVGGSEKSTQYTKKVLANLASKEIPVDEIVKAVIVSKHKRKVLVSEVKSKQNIELSIGGQLPLHLNDSDLPAFIFGLSVLGKWGGFSGRLMSTVREKEGLTYGIYARAEGMTLTEEGFWRIMTFFSPKDTIKGITSTLREIDKITNSGITESEFTRFKTILKTQESLIFDSLSATTNSVHGKLVAGLQWEDYLKLQEGLYTCTRAEINLALKKHLGTEYIIISAAGPTKGLEKELNQFSKQK